MLDRRPHQKLRRFEIWYLLARQYKDLKPAQQALRQPKAPHHAGLFALGSFKLILPNGNTATFTAYVKKFNSQGAVDQAIRRSAELRISGSITWA